MSWNWKYRSSGSGDENWQKRHNCAVKGSSDGSEERKARKRSFSWAFSSAFGALPPNTLATALGNEYKFCETIRFGRFCFQYDNTFLDRLRRLSRQLKVFVTEGSRDKTRIYGQNLEAVHQRIEKEKKELIEKIKINIKKVDEFLKRKAIKDKDKIEKKPKKQTEEQRITQKLFEINRMQRITNSSKAKDCDISDHCLSTSSGTKCTQDVSQQPLDDKTPLFVRQYIYSIESNQTEPTFSGQNICDDSNNSCTCISCLKPDNSSQQQMSFEDNSEDIDYDCDDIQIVNRHKWTNTSYKIETGVLLIEDPENKVRTQTKRHKQIKFVLEKILGLIESDLYCTKRDLYYQNVLLFDTSQRVVDEIIDDLACSLRVSRTKLHIASTTRGLVFGHLSFLNTNRIQTDCLSSPNGISIPNDTERMTRMESNAEFVLIIEKDATFQQLIDLKIHEKYPLIMVTGHGYPDLNTRAFIQILWNSFEIPIFGLVDGDAHGVEILCTFRHGSLALSYESPNLVVPAIKWLGILPTDIRDYRLSPAVQIDLSENDKKKIKDLTQRIYMKDNKEWTHQLKVLLQIGKKVEIQSLAEHSPTFLLDVYLPSKIRYGKWI